MRIVPRLARKAGITINTYALGPNALANPIAATEVARITLGTYLPVRNPGDIVLVEDPTYFVYLGIAQSHGVHCRGIATDHEGVIPDALERVLGGLKQSGKLSRVKMLYLVTYFQNPSGTTTTDERKAAALKIPYFADGTVIRVNTLKGVAPKLSAASSSRISTAERVVYKITKAWGRQYRTSETIIPVAP